MAKNDTIDKIVDSILTAAILGGANANKKTEEKKEEEVTDARKAAHDLGKFLYETYLGFQDAGFTPEQAFELTLAMRD